MTRAHSWPSEVCAYCNGTIYGPMAWTNGDDYCADCFLERFADDVCELLLIVAEVCELWTDTEATVITKGQIEHAYQRFNA